MREAGPLELLARFKAPRVVGALAALMLVAAVTSTSTLARDVLALPDVVILYLSAIMLAAFLFGRGPALLAATLSIAAYNFFFIPPYYTLHVHDLRHLLTFVMMFAVALLVSGLMSRIRRHSAMANAAAMRAHDEEMRSSLLSAVSHDLRTPLAVITGAATALRDAGGASSREQRQELLETICEEAERLERLVANLLDMTRLESNTVILQREWVPLEELVGSALMRLDARLGGRRLELRVAPDLPLASVDPVLFEQVFLNLLENAAKYAGTGPIEVSAKDDGSAVVVEVADSGPGLPRGAEARIFEKFYRGPQTAAAGVGLGLPICRAIVRAHGGELSAENRPAGGAAFRITLPRVSEPPEIRREHPVEQVAE